MNDLIKNIKDYAVKNNVPIMTDDGIEFLTDYNNGEITEFSFTDAFRSRALVPNASSDSLAGDTTFNVISPRFFQNPFLIVFPFFGVILN